MAGVVLVVDPGEALLEMLWTSYGQQEINQLDDLKTFDARVLVQSHKDERDRTARIAALALQAGVNERAIRLAEAYGYQIARLIQGVLGDLNLTGAQQKLVPHVVRANLMAIEDNSANDLPAIEGTAKRAS
jgi:hypothetical protein